MKKISQVLVLVLTVATLLLSACGGTTAIPTSPVAGKVEPIPVAFVGAVDSIAGDQWVINGQTVTVPADVIQEGPFDVGDQVRVEGAVNSDGSFTVSKVEAPSPEDSSTLPQFGNDNSNSSNTTDVNANINADNSNDVNSNDANANSNDVNSNDDNSNGVNTNDDNGNDANSNDDNGNDVNSNDDNANDANSNDDNGNASNSNDDHGGNDNSGDGDDHSGNGNGGGHDDSGGDDNNSND